MDDITATGHRTDSSSTDEGTANPLNEFIWEIIAEKMGVPRLHALAQGGDIQVLQKVLSNGADVDMVDDDGQTALQHLIKFGDENFSTILHTLVDNGADISQTNNAGNNIIFNAVISGRSTADFDDIIGIGGTWNVVNNEGESVLHVAARYGNTEVLEYFISKQVDVNAKDKEGKTPLHSAVFSSNSDENWKDIIELLISNGADINSIDNSGNNVLLNAASVTLAEEKMDYLLGKGADQNAQNKDGYGVLHMAAEAGRLYELQYFVLKGVDVNCRDKNGRTPLFLAKDHEIKFKETVNVFLQNGADIAAVDNDGNSVIFGAIRRGVAKENLEYLVSLGAPWNGKNKVGDGILHVAARWGNFDALKYFVSKGADVKSMNAYGRTPMTVSMFNEKHFKETVSALVSLGADIIDSDGEPLIFIAAMHVKSEENLEYLVSCGADWRELNSNGETVLYWAAVAGNVEALKYFISQGADANAKNEFGEGPISRTLYTDNNFEECVRVLVENGADIYSACPGGGTFFSHLVSENRSKILEWLDQTNRI